jgi:hypothetical protein
VSYTLDIKTARMSIVKDAIDAGSGAGKLEIGTTGMASVLATFPLEDPAASVTDDVLTLLGFPKTVQWGDDGTAAEARIRDSDDADVVTELTVGLTGADIILTSLTAVSGVNVTINASPTITHS